MILLIFLISAIVSVNQVYAEVSDPKSFTKILEDEGGDTPKLLNNMLNGLLPLAVNPSVVNLVRIGEISLKKMCVKNGGSESYNRAQLALKNIGTCFDGIITFAELPKKINDAKKTGDLDAVFKNYCKRSKELTDCSYKFLDEIEPCLTNYQKKRKHEMKKITKDFSEFACDNEGDNIALFIAMGGPDCIANQQQGIEQCIQLGMNESKGDTHDDWLNANKINDLTSNDNDEEQEAQSDLKLCRTMLKIEKCIVDGLKKCNDPTPANVVESIFKLTHRSIKCSTQELYPEHCNGVSTIYRSKLSFIIPTLIILLVRNFNKD